MKKTLFMASAIAFAAADLGGGANGAPTPPPESVKVERLKQNGFTRPLEGTKTGIVWDIADRISADKKRPALRDEVITAYNAEVADARNGTVSTQYSRWCGFHGVQDILRKMRAKEKAKDIEAKAVVKAAKAKEKAEKAEAAAKVKADKAEAAKVKKATADKVKADKAEAAKKAKADKAKAEAEAKAKAAADAAATE